MEIRKVLSIVSTFVFIVLILWAKDKRRTYLLFVLYLLPLVDLAVTPEELGGFSVFDIASYLGLIFILRDFRFTTDRNTSYFILFLLFFLLLLFGSVQSEFVSSSINSLIKLLPIFIYSKAIIEEVNEDPDFIRTIIKALRAVCLASLVFLLLQKVIGVQFSLYSNLNSNVGIEEGAMRYPSFFQDPQKYAQFLSMCSFLFLININPPDKPNTRNYLFFFAVVVGMFLTGARAAFSGLCVGLAIVFLIGESKYRTVGIAGGVFGYLIILLFGQYFPLFNRGESYDESYQFRNQIWGEALDIFHKHTTFGIGVGNYQNYVAIYSPDQFWFMGEGEIMYFDHPESGYLKMLTEYGLFAFILFCSFLLVPIFSAIRRFLLHQTDNRIFYSIGAIFGWMISYITVYSLSDKRVLIPLVTHVCLLILANNRNLTPLYETHDSGSYPSTK